MSILVEMELRIVSYCVIINRTSFQFEEAESMRLSIVKSPNAKQYYVIKDYYDGKKRTSRIVEKLGTDKELRDKLY